MKISKLCGTSIKFHFKLYYYSRILSFPPPEPSAAVIELKFCKLFELLLDMSAGFDDESDDDFMQRFNGASPSSVLDAFDTLLLKFKPAHSFDSADVSFVVEADFDKLYAPFDVIVGGNLITSTRSLFCCDCNCCITNEKTKTKTKVKRQIKLIFLIFILSGESFMILNENQCSPVVVAIADEPQHFVHLLHIPPRDRPA